MPYTPWIIDSSSNSFNNKANQLATRLISYKLSEPERVQVKGCLRTLREHFEGNDKVGDINSSLNDKIKDILFNPKILDKIDEIINKTKTNI